MLIIIIILLLESFFFYITSNWCFFFPLEPEGQQIFWSLLDFSIYPIQF